MSVMTSCYSILAHPRSVTSSYDFSEYVLNRSDQLIYFPVGYIQLTNGFSFQFRIVCGDRERRVCHQDIVIVVTPRPFGPSCGWFDFFSRGFSIGPRGPSMCYRVDRMKRSRNQSHINQHDNNTLVSLQNSSPNMSS